MKSAAAHALADAIVEAAARAAKDAPPVADDLPDDTEALAALSDRAEKALRVAELDGDFGAMGSMGRLLVAIEEHRRKIAPPPPVDLNEAPDIKAAAERGKRLLFETLENVIQTRALLT